MGSSWSSDEHSECRPQAPTTVAAGVAVAAAAVVANRFFLDGDFRATDTLSLIRQGTISSAGDLGRIFSEELLAGTMFEAGPYYRPVSLVSYGLDHGVWGLNAFGYNLTNTILHALVALMTFAVLLRLTRSLAGAVVAGMVMALHPLVVETVPSPARRHDILAVLFVLVALHLVAKTAVGRTSHPITAAMAPASVALVLAVWSKESAVVGIVPLAVVLWLGARDRLPARARLLAWAGQALPLVIGLVVALAVRAYAIGGNDIDPVESASDSLWGVTSESVRLLLHPQSSFVTFPVVGWLAAAAVVTVVVVMAVAGRPGSDARMVAMVAAMSSWWIAGLIVLMAVTGEFSPRTLYGALPAFGMLIGAAATALARCLGRAAVAAPAGVALLVVVASVGATSPAVRGYEQWDVAGRLSTSTLDVLDAWDLDDVKGPAALHVPELPRRVGPGTPPLQPQVRSPTVLVDHALASYLELRHPGTDVRVVVDHETSFPPRAGMVVETAREDRDPARMRLTIAPVPSS